MFEATSFDIGFAPSSSRHHRRAAVIKRVSDGPRIQSSRDVPIAPSAGPECCSICLTKPRRQSSSSSTLPWAIATSGETTSTPLSPRTMLLVPGDRHVPERAIDCDWEGKCSVVLIGPRLSLPGAPLRAVRRARRSLCSHHLDGTRPRCAESRDEHRQAHRNQQYQGHRCEGHAVVRLHPIEQGCNNAAERPRADHAG